MSGVGKHSTAEGSGIPGADCPNHRFRLKAPGPRNYLTA